MGWLVRSLLTMRIGQTRRQGGGADRRSNVEQFDICGGHIAGPGAFSLRDYFDYQARV